MNHHEQEMLNHQQLNKLINVLCRGEEEGRNAHEQSDKDEGINEMLEQN